MLYVTTRRAILLAIVVYLFGLMGLLDGLHGRILSWVGAEARLRGIVPGLPVEACIRTRARTPLAFLLDPFTDYIRHAFREE